MDILFLYLTMLAPAEFIRNNLLILRLLFSAALYNRLQITVNYNHFAALTVHYATLFVRSTLFRDEYLFIYNAAGNNSRKSNKLFCINSAGAGIVKYNNKISAHTQRLINYFELMYAKTM